MSASEPEDLTSGINTSIVPEENSITPEDLEGTLASGVIPFPLDEVVDVEAEGGEEDKGDSQQVIQCSKERKRTSKK